MSTSEFKKYPRTEYVHYCKSIDAELFDNIIAACQNDLQVQKCLAAVLHYAFTGSSLFTDKLPPRIKPTWEQAWKPRLDKSRQGALTQARKNGEYIPDTSGSGTADSVGTQQTDSKIPRDFPAISPQFPTGQYDLPAETPNLLGKVPNVSNVSNLDIEKQIATSTGCSTQSDSDTLLVEGDATSFEIPTYSQAMDVAHEIADAEGWASSEYEEGSYQDASTGGWRGWTEKALEQAVRKWLDFNVERGWRDAHDRPIMDWRQWLRGWMAEREVTPKDVAANPPTYTDIVAALMAMGVPNVADVSTSFYEYYTGTGWRTENGQPLVDLFGTLKAWVRREQEFAESYKRKQAQRH